MKEQATLRPSLGNRRVAPGEIARKAYELYEQRGKAHGNDQKDWFQAERIISQFDREGH